LNELQTELARALTERLGRRVGVASVERRPCPYATSHALEEIDVRLDDGTRLALMRKDLRREALAPNARAAKPSFLHDPAREIDAYRAVLADADLGTPRYYGAVVDRSSPRYSLFIENVPGPVLWQVGELETWCRVSCWLGAMHAGLLPAAQRGLDASFLRYDATFLRLWPRRAVEITQATDPKRLPALERLLERHEEVVGRLSALPATFIHGELFPSNVLVPAGTERVCPIDWEMAAIGPGLVDLAALVAGWAPAEREAMARAYREGLRSRGEAPPLDHLLDALAWCRLHLAVRLLGWAAGWTPPADHRRDWLAEALSAGDDLSL
jgi:hypothetical protein